MGKIATTLSIDERVLAALEVRATRTGLSVDELVEALLRKELGFGLLDRLHERNDMSETEAMAVALEAQRAIRHQTQASLAEAYEAAWREGEDDNGDTRTTLENEEPPS
jgi:hypothetical protein